MCVMHCPCQAPAIVAVVTARIAAIGTMYSPGSTCRLVAAPTVVAIVSTHDGTSVDVKSIVVSIVVVVFGSGAIAMCVVLFRRRHTKLKYRSWHVTVRQTAVPCMCVHCVVL